MEMEYPTCKEQLDDLQNKVSCLPRRQQKQTAGTVAKNHEHITATVPATVPLH